MKRWQRLLALVLGFPIALQSSAAGDPVPEFLGDVSMSRPWIVIGQAFTISVAVRNTGDAGPDGRISISFPSLDHPLDVQLVGSSSSGDQPGYQERPVGSVLADSACVPMTAAYLVAEYVDNAWSGGGGEINSFAVTVAPPDTGLFYFHVRTTHAVAGATCQWVNALPSTGESGFTDQQGWSVKRFAMRVASTVAPIPAFDFGSPTFAPYPEVLVGQSFTINLSVVNFLGGPSTDGRVVVGFPGLTDPAHAQWVTGYGGDSPGYVERPAGSVLFNSFCEPVAGAYLVVEGIDEDWRSSETNAMSVTVRPEVAGALTFEVRATLNYSALGPCQPINAVPSAGVLATDQQGFPVRRFSVNVNVRPRPPEPRFSVAVEGIPLDLTLGGTFTLTTAARNDGSTTGDGRIVVSFPRLDQSGDGQWVTSGSSGDLPGYVERPAGSSLVRPNCAPMTGSYLVTEYIDNAWEGFGAETNAHSITVQPQAAGAFTVEVRSTMVDPSGPCASVNAIPGGNGIVAIDQQGWTVRRFVVNVISDLPPPSPPTTTWARITTPGGGPSARANATTIYHPGQDALVLYGGTDGNYQTDVWSLPIASGPGWTRLTAGGPVPLQRIMHSMIYNPIEDHVVLFAGLYDFPIGDVTVLALSPAVWWFPAIPQGPQPGPRYGHAAVYDPLRHRMVVIGGYDGTLRGDVWTYGLPGTGAWSPMSTAGTAIPARALHAAVYDPMRDRVIVFGGDGGQFLNDVWALSLAGTPAWSLLTPHGTPPDARRDHTMIYDAGRDRVVVFGGFNGTRLNDIWALTLAGEPAWEQLYSSSPSPAGRSMHTAIYDPIRLRMVVFGGETATGQYSSELWSLSFDVPTPTQIAFAGAEVSSDRVRLAWEAPDARLIHAEVLRRAAGEGEWSVLGPARVEGERLTFEDRDVVPGTRYGYRLVERGVTLDEQWVTVPVAAVLTLVGASPNPSDDGISVAFSLPSGDRATLELFDLRGRLVVRREVGSMGAGAHRVTLAEARDVDAGVYLIRLTRTERTLVAKAVVVR